MRDLRPVGGVVMAQIAVLQVTRDARQVVLLDVRRGRLQAERHDEIRDGDDGHRDDRQQEQDIGIALHPAGQPPPEVAQPGQRSQAGGAQRTTPPDRDARHHKGQGARRRPISRAVEQVQCGAEVTEQHEDRRDDEGIHQRELDPAARPRHARQQESAGRQQQQRDDAQNMIDARREVVGIHGSLSPAGIRLSIAYSVPGSKFLVCGLWFVVCGLWFVVCGFWFVVCGLWFVVCGFWFVVSGLWFVVCGLWFVVCGFWFVVIDAFGGEDDLLGQVAACRLLGSKRT